MNCSNASSNKVIDQSGSCNAREERSVDSINPSDCPLSRAVQNFTNSFFELLQSAKGCDEHQKIHILVDSMNSSLNALSKAKANRSSPWSVKDLPWLFEQQKYEECQRIVETSTSVASIPEWQMFQNELKEKVVKMKPEDLKVKNFFSLLCSLGDFKVREIVLSLIMAKQVDKLIYLFTKCYRNNYELADLRTFAIVFFLNEKTCEAELIELIKTGPNYLLTHDQLENFLEYSQKRSEVLKNIFILTDEVFEALISAIPNTYEICGDVVKSFELIAKEHPNKHTIIKKHFNESVILRRFWSQMVSINSTNPHFVDTL